MEGTWCSLPSGVEVPKEQAVMAGTETWHGVVAGCGQLRFGGEFFYGREKFTEVRFVPSFLNFVASDGSRSEVCGQDDGSTLKCRTKKCRFLVVGDYVKA